MAEKPIDLKRVAADYKAFVQRFRSAQLATSSAEGIPEASYAPFIRKGRSFYVYVSELSQHTVNLAVNPRASLLLIENENDARNLFARRRVTYQCKCEEVERGSAPFESAMDRFQAKFGDFIGLLRNLGDFHLYRITPYTGTYVAGFARAFRLACDELDEVQHVNESDIRAAGNNTKEQIPETEEQHKVPE